MRVFSLSFQTTKIANNSTSPDQLTLRQKSVAISWRKIELTLKRVRRSHDHWVGRRTALCETLQVPLAERVGSDFRTTVLAPVNGSAAASSPDPGGSGSGPNQNGPSSTKTVIEMRCFANNRDFHFSGECIDWISGQLVSVVNSNPCKIHLAQLLLIAYQHRDKKTFCYVHRGSLITDVFARPLHCVCTGLKFCDVSAWEIPTTTKSQCSTSLFRLYHIFFLSTVKFSLFLSYFSNLFHKTNQLYLHVP